MTRRAVPVSTGGAVCAAVARASIADRLAFRADVFLAAAMGIARVALALVLWSAVFAGRTEVGGMSLPLVSTYYLVAVFAFQLDQSSVLSFAFAAEIRSGLFGKYLARPVDPLAWFLSACSGRSVFQAAASLSMAVLAGAAVTVIGKGRFLVGLDPLGILAALPVLALGLFALALVNFMTSILAFKFQDIGAFHMAKNCIIEFLSGAMIPLAMLPPSARRAFELTPFPALAFLPADLALGRGWERLPESLAVLVLWDLALFAAARRSFGRLSERYEELGS